jgi:sulfatase maturation enzyme AslB (radical SAM superfamily)
MKIGFYPGLLRDVKLLSLYHAGRVHLESGGAIDEGTFSVGFIEVTSYCPGNCRGCYIPDRRDKQVIDPLLVDRFIDQLKPYGPTQFPIVGGEPFDEVAQDTTLGIIADHPNVFFSICTSGRDIDEGFADRIAQLDNLSVTLSIDGFERNNNMRRGRGAFGEFLIASKLLKQREVLITAYVTINKYNHQEVTDETFVDFLAENGVKVASFHRMFSGEGEINDREYVADLRRLHHMAKNAPLILFSPRFGYMKKPAVGSNHSSLTLGKNGGIKLGRAEESIGSLVDHSLDEIISSSVFQEELRVRRNEHRDGDPSEILSQVLM